MLKIEPGRTSLHPTFVDGNSLIMFSVTRLRPWSIPVRMIIAISLVTLLCSGKRSPAQQTRTTLPRQIARFDKNGDGKISANEMPRRIRAQLLKRYDKNDDDSLDIAELKSYIEDRRAKRKPKKPAADSASGVRKVKNVVYASGPSYGESLGKLDLYLPREHKGFSGADLDSRWRPAQRRQVKIGGRS